MSQIYDKTLRSVGMRIHVNTYSKASVLLAHNTEVTPFGHMSDVGTVKCISNVYHVQGHVDAFPW